MTTPTQDLVLKLKDHYTYDWIHLLSRAQIVALDTETNDKDLPFTEPQDARVSGFSLAIKLDGEYFADYFPVGHSIKGNLSPADWIPILQLATQRTLVMHNAIFDLRILELLGDMAGDTARFQPVKFYDTMKLAHLINENFKNEGYSLDACTLRFLGYAGKKKSLEFQAMLHLAGWGGLSFRNIREYATEDALITYKLFEAETKAIKKEPTIKDYFNTIEAPNLVGLKEFKKLGVKVNIPLAEELRETGLKTMRNIEEEMGVKFSGPGSVKSMQNLFWNELELPQILTKKKRKDGEIVETPSLDKDTMERYELILEARGDSDPTASKLLEFRGWQKAVTSFYGPYLELVNSDGRIRTDFKPHGTVTGRYSSSKPNLQQIPKGSEDKDVKPWNSRVKECFMPEEGYELWEFDYSQLEFRLAALYGNDPKLLDVFTSDDRDIFTEMAVDLGLTRQQCKTLTYSIQYGAGAQRIMDVFGYNKSKAIATINSWYNNYPGIRRISDKASTEARNNLKIEIWSGRYRHFQYKSEQYKAFNSAIQGGAADMVKVSMNNLRKELPELRQILQVHDAIWFEIPKGQVDFYKPQIVSIMEHPIETEKVHFKVAGDRVGTL